MRVLRVIVVATVLIGTGAVSSAAVVTLTAGGESIELEITHCRTDPYSNGQLAIEADVTAVGTFRGESVALFITKVAGDDDDHIDLYLMDLAEGLRAMRPLEARRKIMDDHATLHRRRFAELNAEFSKEALAKLPPDEMMAKFDEQVARIEALEEEMRALKAPMVRSFGALTVDGSTVRFAGSNTRIIDGEDEPAFAGIEGETRVTARCGD